MFKLGLRRLLQFSLMAGVLFVGCSKDDIPDPDNSEKGTIKGLSAGLVTTNGRFVRLTWDHDSTASTPSYDIYRAAEDGEFERKWTNVKNNFYTDNSTNFSTTYQYFLMSGDMYSDTVTIETISQNQPYLTSGVRYIGTGDAATVEYIKIDWRVGSKDDVDRIELQRDGTTITTIRSPWSNSGDYRDSDFSFEFGVDYAYKAIVITNDGTQYESLERVVTPQRPQEQNYETPESPEIVKVTSDRATMLIQVYITDVSERGNDFIAYYMESEELNSFWEGTVRTDELSADENGNLILRLDASGATIPSGKTIWLKSKVKIEIVNINLWSEWSEWNSSVIF